MKPIEELMKEIINLEVEARNLTDGQVKRLLLRKAELKGRLEQQQADLKDETKWLHILRGDIVLRHCEICRAVFDKIQKRLIAQTEKSKEKTE